MTQTMRAVLSVTCGGPDSLEIRTLPVPQPGPGQLRVRVAAVGINYPDMLIIEDRYQFRPERPFSPGAEVAGVVEAVGDDVTIPVGARVIGMQIFGGLAEQVVMPASACFQIPDTMPFDAGAGLLMTYGTAWHALRDRAALKAGESLLVLGAGGGVGLAAVELGLAFGARVIAAASSAAKLEPACALGAAMLAYAPGPLDRTAQRALSAAIRKAAGGQGVDVICDPVGGDYAEPALRSIARGGRYLVVGFPAGIPAIPLNLPLLKECDIRGVFWGAHIEHHPAAHRAAIGELLDLCAAGRIRPRIHQRFAFEQAADAIRALSSRQIIGKVVVVID